jgi:hypothetical protein
MGTYGVVCDDKGEVVGEGTYSISVSRQKVTIVFPSWRGRPLGRSPAAGLELREGSRVVAHELRVTQEVATGRSLPTVTFLGVVGPR